MCIRIILSFFLLGLIFSSCENTNTPTSPAVTTQNKNKQLDDHTTSKTPPPSSKGVIRGTMFYPNNSAFPEDLTVVIRDVNTGNIYSSRKWDKNTGNYSVEVDAPATYEIYALTGLRQGYKAYYSQYVACGMRPECKDHRPILIQLKAGEQKQGVHPIDWNID